ncbi:4814_t:CDS:2 [Entrophospora sp. SA101]|nr:4814_t:CDS:2 [Entrophospora sp. SA101]
MFSFVNFLFINKNKETIYAKINLKAIDRYENDEDTTNDIDSGYDYGERSIKARFFFASSSLSHDARGGLLFDDPHDNKFDDDNVAFDGAENVNDDVDNVDIFADY